MAINETRAKELLDAYKEIDMTFFLISKHITIDLLKLENCLREVFPQIQSVQVNSDLDRLCKDGYIIKGSDGNFTIVNSARLFSGYAYKEFLEKKESDAKDRRDNRTKLFSVIIPLFALLTTMLSVYLTYKNYRLSKENSALSKEIMLSEKKAK